MREEELQQAVNYVVERHESLRTRFVSEEGRAWQKIEERVEVRIGKRDMRGMGEEEQEREVGREMERMIAAPFDLGQTPLMRMVLLQIKDEEHVLGLCLHHIICDAWSLRVLLEELSAAYGAYSEGEEPRLRRIPVQYADYALWQRETLREEKLEQELKYWRQRLQGYEDLNLPTDYIRPRQVSGKGKRLRLWWGDDEVKKLRNFCRERQITLNTLFLGSVYLLMSKYSRQEDICLGMPVANRRRWESEGLIGFFVNMVTVRMEGRGGRWSGEDLLREMQREVLEAQDRQDVPFEKVVEAVQPKRDVSRNPIFQVLVNYVNTGSRRPLTLGLCRMEEMGFDYDISKFDLYFNFVEQQNGSLLAEIVYSTDLFLQETAERIKAHLTRVIEELPKAAVSVDQIDLLTERERAQILTQWNNTTYAHSTSRLVHELIAEQARRIPRQIAVVFEGRQLSYGELDEKTTQLALYLQEQGVTPDTRVGICAERSLEMVVGILGISKGRRGIRSARSRVSRCTYPFYVR